MQGSPSYDLRLSRANEHLEALHEAIQRFRHSNPYEAVSKVYMDAGECIVRLKINEHPPDEWGVLIGDCLHNLRASLDNIVWAMVMKVTKGKLPKHPEWIYFPVIDVAEPCTIDKKLKILPRQARTAIKALQPCNRRNDAKPEVLSTLKGLSNFDKHRIIHPAVYGIPTGAKSRLTVFYNDVEILDQDFSFKPNALEEGAVMATLSFRKTGPNPDVNVDTHFPIEICFHNVSHGLGEPVIPLLGRIHDFIKDRVFPDLEPYI